MYSFKMYDQNDTLLRDYIPVRNSKNEVGLLDLVENKFYENKGTGTFTLGSIVNEITDCSGYRNNGNVIGTASIVTPSPRYNNACYMNNTNTGNHIETNKLTFPDNKCSVSL